MDKNKSSIFKDIALMFNIGWIMIGSVVVGFLIGKWLSNKSGSKWFMIIFALIGAGSGMWTVWKYYKKDIKNG